MSFLYHEKWVNSRKTRKLFVFARRRGRINIPLLYFHRFLRLTPLLAAVILIYASLIRYTGSGPQWPMMINAITSNCAANWWKTLLFIQNYVSAEDMVCFKLVIHNRRTIAHTASIKCMVIILMTLIVHRAIMVFSRRHATISPFTIHCLWYLSVACEVSVYTLDACGALCRLNNCNFYENSFSPYAVSSKKNS